MHNNYVYVTKIIRCTWLPFLRSESQHTYSMLLTCLPVVFLLDIKRI